MPLIVHYVEKDMIIIREKTNMLAEHDAKIIYDDKLTPKNKLHVTSFGQIYGSRLAPLNDLHPGDVREKAMPKVFLGGSGVNSMQ